MPEKPEAAFTSVSELAAALRGGVPLGTAPEEFPVLPKHRGVLSDEADLVRVAGADIRAAVLSTAWTDADPRGLSMSGYLIEGDVNLAGMRDLPHLTFTNCRFTGDLSLELSAALSLDLSYVDVAAVVAEGLKLHGSLVMRACRVGGELTLASARVGGRLDIIGCLAKTIDADKMVVESYMSWLWTSAKSFSFRSGQCCGPHTDGANINLALGQVVAFDLSYAVFTGAVGIGFAGDARAEKSQFGSLNLEGAHVGGALDFEGKFAREINATELQVDGYLSLPTRSDAPSGINLTGATVGDLHVQWDKEDREVLSTSVDATKFWTMLRVRSHVPFTRPHAVPSNSRKPKVKSFDALIDWLPRAERWTPEYASEKSLSSRRFYPQPWMSVANALTAEGRFTEAREVRIRATDLDKKFAARTWLGQASRLITQVVIGHGYKSFRAVWLLAVTYLVSFAVIAAASASFEPIGGASPAGLWRGLYALDVVISPVGSGQFEQWGAGVLWLAITIWVLKLISWALAGLFISGISGVVNRSSDS